MIEAAPGRFVEIPPRPGSLRVQRCKVCADGKVRFVDEPTWVRLGERHITRLRLGLSAMTMRRLVFAGFVRSARPAPNTIIWSLESYFAHLDRVFATYERGEDFWNKDRRRLINNALITGWAGRDEALAADAMPNADFGMRSAE